MYYLIVFNMKITTVTNLSLLQGVGRKMLTTILNITKLDKKGFNSLLMYECENPVCEKKGHISFQIFYFFENHTTVHMK